MRTLTQVIRALMLAAPALASAPAAADLKVFACEPEWAALVEELGGEAVDAYAATTARQDPHHIQPRPSLIARYRNADLAVCTGAELETGWLPVLAQTANNPHLQPGKPGFFLAADSVKLLEVPASVDRAQGDVHPSGSPHLHTDPRNIGRIAAALAERMAQIDPQKAAHYRSRAQDFSKRWDAALERWTAMAEPLQGVRAFSYHREWTYLFDWIGMTLAGTLEPKPGLPPTAGHLEELLSLQAREPARMVLRSAYQDARPAKWLAERADIPEVQLPYTVGGAPGADDLFGLYEVTIQRLLAAAKGG